MTKYRAIKTEVDGIKFDSKKEAQRYQNLKLLERAGKIQNLKLQSVFPVEISGVKICKYKADFEYEESGQRVVEDVKGFRRGVPYTLFRLKAKLVKALYGIEIRET